MAKLSEVTATEMLWQEGSAPSTPASTKWKFYFKTDGLYYMDDAGAETGPLATGGAAPTFVGARAYNSSNISLNNGSYTTITLNSERFDSNTFHDTGSNTERFTVPSGKAGYYIIGAQLEITGSTSGAYRALEVVLGASPTIIGQVQGTLNATSSTKMSVTTLYYLAEADYVWCRAFVNAASLNALATANASPEMWLTLIGA